MAEVGRPGVQSEVLDVVDPFCIFSFIWRARAEHEVRESSRSCESCESSEFSESRESRESRESSESSEFSEFSEFSESLALQVRVVEFESSAAAVAAAAAAAAWRGTSWLHRHQTSTSD